jgi:hypothetical protein
MMALSGALAASTLLVAPAMATDTTPADPGAPTTAPAPAPAPAPAAERAVLTYRNSCNPAIAALPSAVEGDPAVTPGATNDVFAPGLYVWHEAKGWRVRLTHNLKTDVGTPQVIEVRGRITSSRPISNVRTVRLEDTQRGEWVSVQRPKRTVMDFRFVNGGYIDGINFNAGCAGRLTFTAWRVTKDAAGEPSRTPLPIYVGQDITNPVSAAAPQANPGVVTTDAATRVVIRRAPVPAA